VISVGVALLVFWGITAFSPAWPAILLSIAATFLGVLLLFVTRQDVARGGQFEVILTDTELVYESPSWTMGNSFTIRVDGIIRMIHQEENDGHPRYSIETHNGTSHLLSTAAECDYDALFSKIKDINQQSEVIYRG
jgi:hypothetical protein